MTTEAQRRANARYDEQSTTQIKMKLNNKTDKDILDYLKTKSNKQGYIKQLIRNDIKNS